jgi:hypothetical protein
MMVSLMCMLEAMGFMLNKYEVSNSIVVVDVSRSDESGVMLASIRRRVLPFSGKAIIELDTWEPVSGKSRDLISEECSVSEVLDILSAVNKRWDFSMAKLSC